MTSEDGNFIIVRAARDVRRYRSSLDVHFERYKHLPLAKQQVAKAIVRSWRQGLDMKGLARHLGVKSYAVADVYAHLGLPTREQWLQRKFHMFMLRGLTRHAIARRLGISLAKADRLRRKFGFHSTPRWRSLPIVTTDPVQLTLFEGVLTPDGAAPPSA